MTKKIYNLSSFLMILLFLCTLGACNNQKDIDYTKDLDYLEIERFPNSGFGMAKLPFMITHYSGNASVVYIPKSYGNDEVNQISSLYFSAFIGNREIEKIVFEDDCITNIFDYCFYNCVNLTSISADGKISLYQVYQNAFYNTNLLMQEIAVTHVGDYAFNNVMGKIDVINLKDSLYGYDEVLSIGEYAFLNSNIGKIVIYDGFNSYFIAEHAFSGLKEDVVVEFSGTMDKLDLILSANPNSGLNQVVCSDGVWEG